MTPMKPETTANLLLRDDTCIRSLPDSVQLDLKVLADSYLFLLSALVAEITQLDTWAIQRGPIRAAELADRSNRLRTFLIKLDEAAK